MNKTIDLVRFSRIECLQRMDGDLLLELLKPHRLYFKGRKCNIALENGKPDYGQISEILLTPDDEMPTNLVEALSLTDEMGIPKCDCARDPCYPYCVISTTCRARRFKPPNRVAFFVSSNI